MPVLETSKREGAIDIEKTKQRTSVRYQPDENPPTALAFGLGLQLAVLCISGIVLAPAIVARAAGGTEAFLSWIVFAAVAVSGVTTILQAVRVGRIGAGYTLAMGPSGAFIAICITAIAEGGPAMLATLVVLSSFFQFALSARLSLFRRILTPTVAGTVIMLVPVTVMPIAFDLLTAVPDGTSTSAAALIAVATLLTIGGIALKATGFLRLWAPVIGVITGSVVAGFFGLYDVSRVAEASWLGFPGAGWPGYDLDFGPVFWTLAPAFVFVTLVGAVETLGDSVAIQRVAWRRPRAVDFRVVQGTVAADGVGNLLSGLMGTMPNTTYSTSVAVVELTGVGARKVGVVLGLVFLGLAFLPKALAVILAIPGPVAGAYIGVLLSMLFVVGMKVAVQDGIDYRTGLIVGISFWVGVGLQNGWIYPEHVSEFAGGLLSNGITSGGLVAIFMTLFMELTKPRPSRIEVTLDVSVLPRVEEFLQKFASGHGWDSVMADRLYAVTEETLSTLHEQQDRVTNEKGRHLLLTARQEDGEAILEFIAAAGEENLHDRIALLGQRSISAPIEREVSLRLLQHLASSVYHQQYHGMDIVTVRAEAPVPASDVAG